MALSLGKVTILVGAGILGSVLVKEGRMPSVSDVLTGAFKIALKPIKQNDSASTTKKPRNDALIAQVNSLRQELQLLASNRPLTVVTSVATGGRRYGLIIFIVVVGYGAVWWKGWKLSDFMFATKRSLSDACNSVAKQLEQVYSSLSIFRKDISSKIDQTSRTFDENVAYTARIRDEATGLHEGVSNIHLDIDSFSHKIQTLEMRMGKIGELQDLTMDGVGSLMLYTQNIVNAPTDQELRSISPRPAVEQPQITASSRMRSLPPASSMELPSSSASNGSSQVNRPLRNTISGSGLKESGGFSGAIDSTQSPRVSNGNYVNPRVSNGNNSHLQDTGESPTHELPPRQSNVRTGGVFSRTLSATQYFKF